ncbi:TolC family protein [Marinobacteraceae bacterium S3BR75-40.1]
MLVAPLAWSIPERPLGIGEAVAVAQERDPQLQGSRFVQEAVAAQAMAAGSLPDPKVSLATRNLPTDTFDFDQEGMTQLTVGITQRFPRGDSRALKRQKLRTLSGEQPYLRADRRGQVAVTVRQLWLEAFFAQQSIELIQRDYFLFEHLIDAAEAGYASALGRSRQQDVIRAQLELTRLDDRLTALRETLDTNQRQLSEWLGNDLARRSLSPELPTLEPLIAHTWTGDARQRLIDHPAVKAIDQRVTAADTGIELARQSYYPEWALNAQYGHRLDTPGGQDRSGLFSVGITLDVPLFTGNRQDQEVRAATSQKSALKTERALTLRKLEARLSTRQAQLERLDERRSLYRERLLPAMEEQAEASLAAYNSDNGDFAEAVRARIDQLNAKLEALRIAVSRQKALADLAYLLTPPQPTDSNTLSSLRGDHP